MPFQMAVTQLTHSGAGTSPRLFPSSRRQLLRFGFVVGGSLLAPTPPLGARAEARTQLPLNVYAEGIRTASKELEGIRSELASASMQGTEPDWPSLRRRVRGGALGKVRGAIGGADVYVGQGSLEEWEKEAWTSMRGSGVIADIVNGEEGGRALPGVERPNALLCAILSCQNDPRMPLGTNAILDVQMVEIGLEKGAKGRARADGVLLTVEDALAKLSDYLREVERVESQGR